MGFFSIMDSRGQCSLNGVSFLVLLLFQLYNLIRIVSTFIKPSVTDGGYTEKYEVSANGSARFENQ